MLSRSAITERIRAALQSRALVALTGPRQCGKTTLARAFLLPEDSPNYFDLEDPFARARLDEPRTALESLRGLVVLDEIQRRPDLFPLLRELADRPGQPAQFLVLASTSGTLLRQDLSSLADQMQRIDIGGLTLAEAGAEQADVLWQRGALPRAFLAGSDADSLAWRKQFIQNFLERDLPQWGVRVPATALLRFWTMLAQAHGQTWNAAQPARALGVSPNTTRHYLGLLTDALMIRQVQPWHADIGKRQVKAPKLYVRDSGLLHQLLGLTNETAILSHPKADASWEGFAVEQVLATEPHDEAAFWGTHQGAEIDLVLRRGDKLYGVECKRMDAPRVTPSMRFALEDLGLERIAVVYPGMTRYALAERIEVVPLSALAGPMDGVVPSSPGLFAE